jgi:chemotaxis family two-component system sensor kinase Cph1
MSFDKSSTENRILGETQHFLQSAVHDLRAAQRRTAISAELLIEAPPGPERNELVSQISLGLSKTEELLAGISKYATALTPTHYSFTTFPATTAVRFALANLDREIRESGATITVAELPEVLGDRDRVVELFEHLIGNSLKFRGSHQLLVEIGAQRVPEGWLFSVKDNGAGIVPKYRDRLFTAFRRLEGADVPGSGLGLAISKKIIEGHEGRIWIEDNQDPGVTFCFILKAVDGD